jgi:hypothetical protein
VLTRFLVIQGAADMGQRLSETELQNSLDFCAKLFNPTTPEDHERVSQRPGVGQELLDVTAPLMDPSTLDQILTANNATAVAVADPNQQTDEKLVLDKVNARRVIHQEYAINTMESEPLIGYTVRLEHGRLGLQKAAA